ncbi:MAG: hypothetical protein HY914_10405 [Desulfomonile tiedjei]|nr:hypothetical protein [Desulfomonile tiedjei]
MDLLVKHFGALMNLVFGGVLVIGAVYAFIKHRSFQGMVLWLSFGVAFTTLGLLALVGLMDPEWVDVSSGAVFGMCLIWFSISTLCSPPSPSFPNWTQWAMLVFGVGSLLAAISAGLRFAK